MAESIIFNLPTYSDVMQIANELAELENRTATNAVETLIKEHGPTKIERIKAEKKAREG